MAHSAEEEVARDFICFGGANAVVVVCDASCLERNLNLALQAMEITDNVVLCVNLMDEARRKGVEVDAALLEQRLGVPVVPAAARSGEGLPELMCAVERVIRGECAARVCRVRYAQPLEAALALLTPAVANAVGTGGRRHGAECRNCAVSGLFACAASGCGGNTGAGKASSCGRGRHAGGAAR